MKRFTILATVVLLTFSAHRAAACSCPPPPPPKQAMEFAVAVFSGKVTDIERPKEGSLRVSFEVDRAWKGKVGKTIVIETPPDDGICGYRFEKDKSYVVYAVEHAETKAVYTTVCQRTRKVEDAKDDFRDLGEGKKPAEEKKPEQK
jgi:hypothetical protein